MELNSINIEHTYDTLVKEESESSSVSKQDIKPNAAVNLKHGVNLKNKPLKVMVCVQMSINILLLSGLIIGFSVVATVKVDGRWAQWSQWSQCDVKGVNGSQTRFRTCTNPPPSQSGQHCTGHSIDSRNCPTDFYSDKNVLSPWSSWGSCSVTCEFGIQRRERSCLHATDSPSGQYCFGELRDYRLCKLAACTDGGWSSWSSWEDCSETCGGGMRLKSRTCTEPKPSLLGKQCLGSHLQVDLCNMQSCQDDGVWSNWSPWSPCDVTCGSGSKTRLRTCTNKQHVNGSQTQNCSGNDSDITICHRNPCSEYEKHIAFTAYGVRAINLSLTFPDVIINFGNGYDNSTGLFTCKVPGTYHFAVQVSKAQNVFALEVTCSIMINANAELSASEKPFLNDINNRNGFSLSLSGTFYLKENDTASIRCNNVQKLSGSRFCSFTGFLITPNY